MKATEQYFPVVLSNMLDKVVLNFVSVNVILNCYQANESYWAVLFCGAVFYAVQDVYKFDSVNVSLKCDHWNHMKATERYFPVVLQSNMLDKKVVQSFESAYEILKSGQSK